MHWTRIFAAVFLVAVAVFIVLQATDRDRTRGSGPPLPNSDSPLPSVDLFEVLSPTDAPDDAHSNDTEAPLATVAELPSDGRLYVLRQRLVPFIRNMTKRGPDSEWCALEAMVTPRAPSTAAGVAQLPLCEPDRRAWDASVLASASRRCRIEFGSQHGCLREIPRFGNFTAPVDLARFTPFPVVPKSELHWSKVTAQQRRALWDVSPNPFDPRCATCVDSLVHESVAFMARRWWAVASWTRHSHDAATGKLLSDADTRATRLMGLAETDLVGGTFGIMVDDETLPSEKWRNVSLSTVTAVTMCLPDTPLDDDIGDPQLAAFVALRAGATVHTVRFLQPNAGARCFWRSLQILFAQGDRDVPHLVFTPDGPKVSATVLRKRDCGRGAEATVASQLLGSRQSVEGATPLRADAVLPYVPCFQTLIGPKTKLAQVQGGMDPRYLNFWPFRCNAGYLGATASDCSGTPQKRVALIASATPSAASNIKVAVLMSGFFRSFAFARQQIMNNLVHPHDADLFGVTWNVIGRVKKARPITPKMIVGLGKMHNMVWALLQVSGRPGDSLADIRRKYQVQIWDYKKYARLHAQVKTNGFHHAGMYHQMQESVAMMVRSRRTYDVVIRTRWDLFVATKFALQRLPAAPGDKAASARYLLDLGVHCHMDDAWYPRNLIVEEGKTIRHIADTRFKLFGWQSCDWLDIAPYNTMVKMNSLYDWIRKYNVYSGAQWVEHAFFLDQGIAWQPAHLFLCLHRHSTRFFC